MEDERTTQITTMLQEGIEIAEKLGHTLETWYYVTPGADTHIQARCTKCGLLARIDLVPAIALVMRSVAFYGPCLPNELTIRASAERATR